MERSGTNKSLHGGLVCRSLPYGLCFLSFFIIISIRERERGRRLQLFTIIKIFLILSRVLFLILVIFSAPIHFLTLVKERKREMGHHSCCNKQKVKRGLWSPEEDEKLVNYITTYGHGCWSSVPRRAGFFFFFS